jgi:phosphoribosyl 1,2-cyclic phosphodiesterase
MVAPTMVEFTVLASGSSGNCAAVRYQNRVLLVDAGLTAKEIHHRLETAAIPVEQLIAIVVSHEHTDHIRSVRTLSQRYPHVPVYTNSLTAERLHHLGQRPQNLVLFANGTPFDVGPFRVEPFSVSHDAADPVGFRIDVADRKIGIATDLGHIGKLVPVKLKDCHVLMLEANHDVRMLRNSKRPLRLQQRILGRRGHLSNESGMELVTQTAGPTTRYLVMAHVSEECNKRELIEIRVNQCLQSLNRHDIEVEIACQDHITRTLVV